MAIVGRAQCGACACRAALLQPQRDGLRAILDHGQRTAQIVRDDKAIDEEFRAFVKAEIVKWARVVKEAGLKVE